MPGLFNSGFRPYRERKAISVGSSDAQSLGGLGSFGGTHNIRARMGAGRGAPSPTYQALGAPAATGPARSALAPSSSGGGESTSQFEAALSQWAGKYPGLEQGDSFASGVVRGARNQIESAKMGGAIGLGGALNPPPEIAQFYQTLLGNRLRAAETIAGSQRNAALNALEARGMGQSTEVARAFNDIGYRQQLAGQEAAAGVQALQYAAYQSALDFERQKYLTRLRADVAQDRKPWWSSALPIVGDVIGMIAGGGLGGAPSPDPNAGGYGQTWN